MHGGLHTRIGDLFYCVSVLFSVHEGLHIRIGDLFTVSLFYLVCTRGLHIRIGDRGLSWDLFPEEISRLSNGGHVVLSNGCQQRLLVAVYIHITQMW